MIPKLLFLALGGALGTISRHGITSLANKYFEHPFGFGTFAVNLLGCFAIGCLWSYWQSRMHLGEEIRLFLFVGLLGGFTTFSSYMLESVELLRQGNMALACLNLLGSTILGLGGLLLGLRLGRLF